LHDQDVYFGPHAQWRKLRRRGCITNIVCFKEDNVIDSHDVMLLLKRGKSYTGEFCIAVTTGKCQKDKDGIIIDSSEMTVKCSIETNEMVIKLNINEICQQYQIEAPV
jgi:hypothetical protein